MRTFFLIIYLFMGDVVSEAVEVEEGLAFCKEIVKRVEDKANIQIPDLQFIGCVQTNTGKKASA